MPPNLFDYATSELSQDAFLAWLAEWADPCNATENPALHRAGVAFIGALRHEATEPWTPCSVRVHLQLKWVDLAIELGDDEVIIIEDKTTSTVKKRVVVEDSETGNSKTRTERLALVDYAEAMGKHFDGRQLHFSYLKTGDEHPPTLPDGWHRVSRSSVLDVLKPHVATVSSDIFHDYVQRLQRLEDRFNAWEAQAPDEWHVDAWKGFFSALASKLDRAGWRYEANPQGGELVLWWGEHKGVYPLIRVWPSRTGEGGLDWSRMNRQLTVRMDTVEHPGKRREYEKALCGVGAGFSKPRRRAPGKTVRLAEMADCFLRGTDTRVDPGRTAEHLKLLHRRILRATTGEPPIARQ